MKEKLIKKIEKATATDGEASSEGLILSRVSRFTGVKKDDLTEKELQEFLGTHYFINSVTTLLHGQAKKLVFSIAHQSAKKAVSDGYGTAITTSISIFFSAVVLFILAPISVCTVGYYALKKQGPYKKLMTDIVKLGEENQNFELKNSEINDLQKQIDKKQKQKNLLEKSKAADLAGEIAVLDDEIAKLRAEIVPLQKEHDRMQEKLGKIQEKTFSKLFELLDKVLGSESFFRYLGEKGNFASILEITEKFYHSSIDAKIKEIKSKQNGLSDGREIKDLSHEQKKTLARYSEEIKLLENQKKLFVNLKAQLINFVQKNGVDSIAGTDVASFFKDITSGIISYGGEDFVARIASAVAVAFGNSSNKTVFKSNALKSFIIEFINTNYELLNQSKIPQRYGVKLPNFKEKKVTREDNAQKAARKAREKTKQKEFVTNTVNLAIDLIFDISTIIQNQPDLVQRGVMMVLDAQKLNADLDLAIKNVRDLAKKHKIDPDNPPKYGTYKLKVQSHLKEAMSFINTILQDSQKVSGILDQSRFKSLCGVINQFTIKQYTDFLKLQNQILASEDRDKNALAIKFNTAQIIRLGILAEILENNSEKIYKIFGKDATKFVHDALTLTLNYERTEKHEDYDDIPIISVISDMMDKNKEYDLIKKKELTNLLKFVAREHGRSLRKALSMTFEIGLEYGRTHYSPETQLKVEGDLRLALQVLKGALKKGLVLKSLPSAENIKSILDTISGIYPDSHIKALKKKNRELEERNNEIGPKYHKEEIASNKKAIAANKQQIKYLNLLKNIMKNNAKELHDALGVELGSFLQEILAKVASKDGMQLIDFVTDVVKLCATKNTIKREGVKNLITAVIKQNYKFISEIMPDLPHIKNEVKRNKFIEDTIVSTIDLVMDFGESLGLNEEFIHNSVRLFFALSIEELQEEYVALTSTHAQIKASGAATELKIGGNVLAIINLFKSALKDKEGLGRTFSENHATKVCQIVGRFTIIPQIKSVHRSKSLKPKEKQNNIRALKIAYNILDQHSKELYQIFDKDIGVFLENIATILSTRHQVDGVEVPLTVLSMLSNIITQSASLDLVHKDKFKVLMVKTIQENHELIRELAPTLPRMEDKEKRNEYIENAVGKAIDIIADAAGALATNPEFVENTIKTAFAFSVTELKEEVAELTGDELKRIKQEGPQTSLKLGKNITSILDLFETALKDEVGVLNALSEENVVNICNMASQLVITPMIKEIQASEELDKTGKKASRLETLGVIKNMLDNHARELYQVFDKDLGKFLDSTVKSIKTREVEIGGEKTEIALTVMDILSSMLVKCGSLNLVKKEQFKSLLKIIVKENRAIIERQLGEKASKALIFSDVANITLKDQKTDSMLDAAVDAMYEISSAIGKNNKISRKIVEILFDFTKIDKKAEKEEGAESENTAEEKSKEELAREAKIKGRERYNKLAALLVMVSDEDRPKVAKSIFKLVEFVKLPGREKLFERLQLGSEVFVYLADELKDKEFCQGLAIKIGEVIYQPDGFDLTKVVMLAQYVRDFYNQKEVTEEQKKLYIQQIALKIAEIGIGFVREFGFEENIGSYCKDMFMLFYDLAVDPDTAVTLLKILDGKKKGGYWGAATASSIDSAGHAAFSFLSTALKQYVESGLAMLEFPKMLSEEIQKEGVASFKISQILETLEQKYEALKSVNARYAKLGYACQLKFQNPIDFSNVEFDCDISLHGCSFEKPVKLLGSNCTNGNLKLIHCKFLNLELHLNSVQEIEAAIGAIGQNTFTALIREGKINIKLKLSEKDRIEDIQRAFAVMVKAKSKKEKEHLIDNFAALLLNGAINFENTLNDTQKSELNQLFYKSQKKSYYRADNKLLQYILPKEVLQRYKTNHTFLQFKNYCQYAKDTFTILSFRKVVTKKYPGLALQISLYSVLSKKYAKSKQQLFIRGRNGSLEIDPKVIELIGNIKDIGTASIAKEYSSIIAQIIAKEGIQAIEELNSIKKKLKDALGENPRYISLVMQAILEEMNLQIIKKEKDLKACMGIINKRLALEDGAFKSDEILIYYLDHELDALGIENTDTGQQIIEILRGTKNFEKRQKLAHSIIDMLIFDIPEEQQSLIGEENFSVLRNNIIAALHSKFLAKSSETIEKASSGELRSILNTWLSQEIETLQQEEKAELDLAEHFKKINVINIKKVFDLAIKPDELKKKEEKTEEEKKSQADSGYIGNLWGAAVNASFYIGSSALKMVGFTAEQESRKSSNLTRGQ